jgi:flagellar hook-associated protein 3 FlgL
MNLTQLGDLSQNTYMFTRTAQLKQNVAHLQQELSTGKTSDLPGRLGGNFNYIADIEKNLSRLDSYETVISETAYYAGMTQASVGRINDLSQRFGEDLLSVGGIAKPDQIDQLSTQSADYLAQTISALNTSVGGRSLFAGTDTDAVPVADAGTIMTALTAEVAGLTTANDIVQAVQDWFADPAGFDAVAYNGSFTDMSPVKIGSTEEVSIAKRADDPEFKQAMASFAVGALISDPGLAYNETLKRDLVIATSGEMQETKNQMIAVQADIGFTEARIEDTSARNAAEKTSLSLAMNELVQADPYETITRLEEAQFQLEAIYTVTSRSSQISLLDYMR